LVSSSPSFVPSADSPPSSSSSSSSTPHHQYLNHDHQPLILSPAWIASLIPNDPAKMAEVYRETRVYRDEPSDDDERYRSTTVRRYKVNPGRYERSVVEVDDHDDRRSRYSGRPAADLLEIDRRSAVPDRPRSAFEPYGDRDRERDRYYEREFEREREPDRSRVSVFESREVDRDRDWDKRSRHSHAHSHHHHHHHDDDEIRVEKKFEERYEDPHGHEVERYRKETEYYTQA
jgi:hypothetical protein